MSVADEGQPQRAGAATNLRRRGTTTGSIHYAGVAIVALVGLFYLGTPKFPWATNLYHVPIVLDYAASAEGPHDAFHRSLANFVSYFWLPLRFVATDANIEALFIVLAFLGFATTVAALFFVAATTADDRGPWVGVVVALVASMAAFNAGTPFGNAELLARVASHSKFATALCLLSVGLACRNHWVLAGLTIGLAGNVNLFLAFWVGGTLFIVLAMLAWRGQLPTRQDGAAPGLSPLFSFPAIATAATTPTVFWVISIENGAAPGFSYAQFLYDYYPHHFFSHLRPAAALTFFGSTGITLAIIIQLMPSTLGRSTLVRFMAAGLVLLLASTPLFYLLDSRLLLNLHPLRFVGILTLCEAAVLIAAWCRLHREGDPRADALLIAVVGLGLPGGALKLLGLSLFVRQSDLGRAWSWLAWGATLAAAALTLQWHTTASWTQPSRLPPLMVAIAMLAVSGKGQRAWWRLVVMALAGAIAIAPILTMSEGLTPEDGLWTAGVGGAIAAAFLVGEMMRQTFALRPTDVLATVVTLSVIVGLGFAARAGMGSSPDSQLDDFKAAQAWARSNTPPGTLFFSPHMDGFATLSRRPVWFDHAQGAAVMWQPAFYAEWEEGRRLAAQSRTLDALLELGRSHGIQYLVLNVRRNASPAVNGAQIVYQNNTFLIAKLH